MFSKIRSAVRGSRERAVHRRQYRAMLALDDHLLRDIGVRRDEIRSRLAP